MRNLLIFCALCLSFSNLKSQISIAEFRKLEEKVNALVVENQTLKKQVSEMQASLDRVNQANRSQNSNIASNKKSLEEKIEAQNAIIASSIEALTNQVSISIRENESKTRAAISKINNLLPIGSIVAFDLDESDIPSNWVLCDGRKITDPNSIYNGYNVPNLSGYFIRGKTSNEDIGDVGGRDDIPSHSHSISSHKHEVGDHTHTFTTSSNRGGFHYKTIKYVDLMRAIPNGDAFYGYQQKVVYFDDYGNYSGNHAHSGTTSNASSGYTQTSGGGSTGSAGGSSNIPKYQAYSYIIKIK